MLRSFTKELEQDREFEIGGEVFSFIYPNWEVGAEVFDEELTPAPNGDGEVGQFSWKADTQKAIERVPIYLNPKDDALKRWKALVAKKPKDGQDAVPRFQIAQLYRWLVLTTQNLPTNPPSSGLSDDGGGTTEPESSAGSPSTEATPTK